MAFIDYKNRILSILLIIGMLCTLTACGDKSGGIPNNTSERMYEIGLAALETVDEYLDGSIDLETARRRIDSSKDSADWQLEKDQDEVGETLTGTKYSNDFFINHELFMLSIDLMNKDHGTGTNKDITEDRNDLAKWINEKSR